MYWFFLLPGIQTAFKLSIPTLNLTYTPDLGYNTSAKFMRHAGLFCNDVSPRPVLYLPVPLT